MLQSTKEARGLPRSVILLGLAIGVLVDVVVVVLIATSIGVYLSGGPSPSLDTTTTLILFAGLAMTIAFSILLARHKGMQQHK